MNIGFLGAGKMATAIAHGLVTHNIFATEQLAAVDVDDRARQTFASVTGARCGDDAPTMLANAQCVIVAVKPQVAREAVVPLTSCLHDRLVISIAAGVPLEKLCQWVGHKRVVRAMPNTPMTVGKGATAFCSATEVTDEDEKLVECIFGAVGIVCKTTEDRMDAVTALSGSGPAYVFELIQALVDAAEDVGLPAAQALRLSTQTVAGAAEMVQSELGTPLELRNAVTSPGGTTEAGLRVLEENEFRTLIKRVVRAARDRSVELGKGEN